MTKTQAETITQWARYGVAIEQDTRGFWQWAETDRAFGDVNGPHSPPFSTFESCIGDLESAFGPMPDNA